MGADVYVSANGVYMTAQCEFAKAMLAGRAEYGRGLAYCLSFDRRCGCVVDVESLVPPMGPFRRATAEETTAYWNRRLPEYA